MPINDTAHLDLQNYAEILTKHSKQYFSQYENDIFL